ncbi:MAG: hypothetical protein M3O35_21745 [Acidobacteriota bacterium]|nr:hypothetical protein [Acidobacteriota bacterium]
MREADGSPNDRTNRTLAKWNEIESLAAGLAVQALQDLARDSDRYIAEVKAATAAKQTLRQLIVMAAEEVSRTAAEPKKRPVPLRQLETLVEDLKSSLDSMNEMSEETSMRLQMAVDRRSKFVAALSNIMKAIGDTQNTLVSNLK